MAIVTAPLENQMETAKTETYVRKEPTHAEAKQNASLN
jgi:hypothetical protein